MLAKHRFTSTANLASYRRLRVFLLFAVIGLASRVVAAEFFIHDGDRVAFLGDSITEGGKYTTYLQAYALTRHPQWRLTFRNVGWRGDTSWLRNRYKTDETALFAADNATQQKIVNSAVEHGLARDVLPLKPTVVTVSMGMNDSYAGRPGEAYPPFIRAETKIVDVLKGKGIRVALLTPQAMEGSGPPPDLDGGNKALKMFSAGIKEVAAKTGVPFVDQYNPYLAICVSAHAAKPHEFLYSNGGDRIHPSTVGQTIQAWIILKALDASSLVSRAEIDSATQTVVAAEACRIEKLTVADGTMSFDRSDEALPMPLPPEAGTALKLAPILEDLNRYELQITGLAPGSYELSIDGEAVTKLTAAELAKGWNMAASAGPITRQGQELLKQIKEKDELFYGRWRKVQLFEVAEWAQKPADARTVELARLDQKIADAEAQIEKLRQPHPHHFELKAAIADGPFKPTFESLKQYQVPEWFMDAKLGIFMHWGPASVGGTSGWFGREMYRQGSDSYKFVVKNFGHPSKFGYKDLCKLFKADKFDDAQADALVKLYKKAGARYIVPVAVHHDNFDMWESKYQPRWNAKVTTGKDIIGIWKKAADANGLRFGVASHVARTYRWFLTSHQADKTGPLKGVPYDGADPQFSDLYGVPWKTVDPTFPGWSGDCAYEVSRDEGPPEWERQFERRMRDLLDRYQPDLYYVDGGIPFHVHPAGLNILAHYYNSSIAHHDGKLEAVANIKCDWQPNIAVLDYEGAAKGGMPEYYWQSDQSINGEWFWTRYDKPEEYTSAKRIIATLMDNISRKGNLLLNLPLKPDGTFDPAVIKILEEMGQCTSTIGEAIYGTRAWEVYGEGPTDFSKGFAAGTARDIRFTRNKANTVLYATMLDWPGDAAALTITTLKAGRFDAGAIASITMLGARGNLTWKQDAAGLHVTLPDAAPGADAYSLKMTFKTAHIADLRTCSTAPKENSAAGSLTIDVGNPSHAISPILYGMMTEEINHSYDGGLYAELIQNRAFKDNPTQPVHWSVVQDGGSGSMAIDKTDPLTPALSSSLKVSITSASNAQRVGIANDGFWGIPVKPHTTYRASFYAQAADGFGGPLTVAIESKDGATIAAKATVPGITSRWDKYEATLTTGDVAPSLDNRFVISATHAGTVRFSLVSLFPPTYKNRPNGNRIDLMQKLADMHPAFLRLPGGNYLDPGHYIWKNTIGPLENRPGNPGAWGYRASEGLGILEFLEWCEDLNIEAILGVSDGRGWLPDNADVGPLVQDALDEIEYITGGPETTWGAKRIAHGHSAAFPLRYVEIGNEDATPPYATRFVKFYDAIRGKYPKLKIIHNQLVRDLSSLTRIPDVIDDHFYDPPSRMERRAAHYDNYPRTAPKIFVGEWATVDWSYSGTPTFEESLADAAWMTGLERNSDVVIMHCYAPLLVNMNKGGLQWPVNLIGYDALNSFGSPSYYAQKMFAANRSDVVLPVSVVPASLLPPVPVKISGGVGVDAWDGKAEIQDVRVISGDAVLYQSDFANGMKGWKQRDDKWKVQNGVLTNTGAGRVTAGDEKWTDYTFSLKVRKTNNNNLYILFHVRGEHEYLKWEISNRGRTSLEKHDGDFRRTICPEIPFQFQTGSWYNLRVELKKDSIRCFVDDKLVIATADNQQIIPPVPPLYATASRDKVSGDIILKAVNVGPAPQPLAIAFKGVASIVPVAAGEMLTGNPQDRNSLKEPSRIVPVPITIIDAAPRFAHEFPPYSINVVRFKVGKP